MNEPTLIYDIRDAIDNDKYMFICIWGEPRTGKSMLGLNVLGWIYRDWNKVLEAIAFDLNGILYRIKNKIPELWPTYNKLHMRIPVLLWDDWGARSNKAQIQFQMAWNLFKGGFDVLGTRLGCLLATMVQPSEATQQIANKYTHELWVDFRGHYKYDRYHQRQDYHGFRSSGKKEWLDEQYFKPVPEWVFQAYDEMRTSLVDEVIQAIEDVMVETEMTTILRRIQPIDLQLLKMAEERGLIYRKIVLEQFGEEGRKAIVRLKSRGLLTPRRMGNHYYKLDLTDLGLNVLRESEKELVPKVSKSSTL